jgi:hypothetical protein
MTPGWGRAGGRAEWIVLALASATERPVSITGGLEDAQNDGGAAQR